MEIESKIKSLSESLEKITASIQNENLTSKPIIDIEAPKDIINPRASSHRDTVR